MRIICVLYLLVLVPSCSLDLDRFNLRMPDAGTSGSGGIGHLSDGSAKDVCGDGYRTGAEVCDDGNRINEVADACPYGSTDCTFCQADCGAEIHLVGGFCGDGVASGPEDCDHSGEPVGACEYGVTCLVCGNSCSFEIGIIPDCGDGNLDAAYEVCDDGNQDTCGHCTADCGAYRVQASVDIVLADAVPRHGETFTIGDGRHTVTFVFIDVDADSGVPSVDSDAGSPDLDVDAGVTEAHANALVELGATDLSSEIVRAIHATALKMNVAVVSTGLQLRSQTNWATGGVAHEAVVDERFVVSFTDGDGRPCPPAVGCAIGSDCASGICEPDGICR